MPLPLPNASWTLVAAQIEREHLRPSGARDAGVGDRSTAAELLLERRDDLLAGFRHAERRWRPRGSCAPARRSSSSFGKRRRRTPAAASCVEHLGRAGVVVGDHDRGLEGQDRLGDECALVADLRRLLRRLVGIRRRDVGGHDLVAEPEGVDHLGDVAVDRHDALGGRRRRARSDARRGVATAVVAVRWRGAASSPVPPPHAATASSAARATTRDLIERAPRHELDDEAAHVLVRRGRFGEPEADDGEAVVTGEVAATYSQP